MPLARPPAAGPRDRGRIFPTRTAGGSGYRRAAARRREALAAGRDPRREAGPGFRPRGGADDPRLGGRARGGRPVRLASSPRLAPRSRAHGPRGPSGGGRRGEPPGPRPGGVALAAARGPAGHGRGREPARPGVPPDPGRAADLRRYGPAARGLGQSSGGRAAGRAPRGLAAGVGRGRPARADRQERPSADPGPQRPFHGRDAGPRGRASRRARGAEGPGPVARGVGVRGGRAAAPGRHHGRQSGGHGPDRPAPGMARAPRFFHLPTSFVWAASCGSTWTAAP